MAATTKLFAQVEEALADPRVLDRELIRELLDTARLLESALVDACRANMELRAMDKNVAASAGALRDAIDALNQSYTQPTEVNDEELARAVENQIETARSSLNG